MFFNSHMMTSALQRGEYREAEGIAGALADYTAKEPFPWADFLIRRARVLIRHGRGERTPEVEAELARMAELGRKLNFIRATRALDEALGVSSTG
jgi:hypothetical protein